MSDILQEWGFACAGRSGELMAKKNSNNFDPVVFQAYAPTLSELQMELI